MAVGSNRRVSAVDLAVTPNPCTRLSQFHRGEDNLYAPRAYRPSNRLPLLDARDSRRSTFQHAL